MTQVAEGPTKVCSQCRKHYRADSLFCPDDGIPLVPLREEAFRGEREDPYIGKEILGHILVQEVVGVGAMGRVYRAFQKGIDRNVAVKILHRELSSNAELVARFNREAKVASKLVHSHVVQVYFAGQLPDGAMYIVMEYLDGLSLASVLSAAAQKAMPIERTLRIAAQLCDAVGEAHTQQVVHRDLKPENVMLVKRGEDPDFVKVLDFGIARVRWNEESVGTATGLIFGTARYISPEGAQGLHVSPASDVYGLAILVYQMLSGRTPFDAEQPVALMIQQIHEVPKDVRAFCDAPAAIAQVIMKNLAKDPTARDPNARVFGRALLEAARASGIAPEGLLGSPLLRDAFARSTPGVPIATLPLGKGETESAPTNGTVRLASAPELRALDASPLPAHAMRAREVTELGAPAVAPISSPTVPIASNPGGYAETPGVPQKPVWPIVLGCFVVGAAAALGIAWQLGFWGTQTPAVTTAATVTERPGASSGTALDTSPSASGDLSPLKPAPRPLPNQTLPTRTTATVSATSTAANSKPTLALTAAPNDGPPGQNVQFAATLLDPSLQKEHADDAAFAISGPGVSTRLAAVGEGVMYRAALTLYEPGTYNVTFTITSGGKLHTQTRSVRIKAPAAEQPTAPAPTGTVRWL